MAKNSTVWFQSLDRFIYHLTNEGIVAANHSSIMMYMGVCVCEWCPHTATFSYRMPLVLYFFDGLNVQYEMLMKLNSVCTQTSGGF